MNSGSDRNKLEQLLRTVAHSEDKEIVCSEFFQRLPAFVEQELNGANAEALFPDIALHMHQCAECAEVYRALRELVLLEKTDPSSLDEQGQKAGPRQ